MKIRKVRTSAPVLVGLVLTALAPAARAAARAPRFDVLVIAETRGKNGQPEIHAPFVERARPWLDKLAAEEGFSVTTVDSPGVLTEAYLAKFELVFQMNYTPYRWSRTAQAALEKYVDGGQGGWIGIHHALLVGPVVTPKSEAPWTWFYDFIGQINYKAYIPGFAEATVEVEAPEHPIFRGVPRSFVVSKDEWYIWDRSPRPRVRVLASVDEGSYKPDSKIKMGDHPVVWTNEKRQGRNLFIFMGHHPDHFDNAAYRTLLRNSILWAASKD